MVHEIVVAVSGRPPRGVDGEFLLDGCNLRVGAGQAEQPRMEGGNIGFEHGRRVPRGIDRDEDRLKPRRLPGRVLLELPERLADRLEIGRADVRAEAVTEIDQAVAAREIGVADGAAVLIGERERAADPRALQRRRVGRARAGAEQQRADQRKAGRPQLHPFVHSVASLALLRAHDQETWPRGAAVKDGFLGRLAAAVALALALVAVPAHAQQFSDTYKFLKAVKDRDGTVATDLLAQPGSIVINAKDSSGDAALHILTRQRDMLWVGFLLGKGAKPDIQDRDGDTPLALAAQIGWVEGAERLLSSGAKVDLPNSRGETPLILAVHSH